MNEDIKIFSKQKDKRKFALHGRTIVCKGLKFQQFQLKFRSVVSLFLIKETQKVNGNWIILLFILLLFTNYVVNYASFFKSIEPEDDTSQLRRSACNSVHFSENNLVKKARGVR